jgi:hypothetical protein
MQPMQFECRKIAMKQDKTGFILSMAIHPDELPEMLVRDFVGSRYMCVMVRLNDDETPKHYDNLVSKAGMLCRDGFFQNFMVEAYLAEKHSEDACAKALCEKCGIESRTELNGNHLAQTLFKEIVVEFEKWKDAGEEF